MTLTVIGDGVRKDEFQQQFANSHSGDRVTFTGRINHSVIPSILLQHTIGINYMRPSDANHCRAILKLREYLACGLQVVCNDVGDGELFKEHVIIKPSLDEMEKQLDGLLDNYPGINTSGSQFVHQKYDWKPIVNEFLTHITPEKNL